MRCSIGTVFSKLVGGGQRLLHRVPTAVWFASPITLGAPKAPAVCDQHTGAGTKPTAVVLARELLGGL